jgi:DHA1 family bicyclomycin/chloramphenicol resistance-like MFS transporter
VNSPFHHHQSRPRWHLAALLAGLATLGPFSVDTYLPAFAGMQAALPATALQMQQTLSAYLLAFGLMFLFHGALSDSFGRKPVIVIALAVFTIGSAGAALSTEIHWLIGFRMLQGASAGAGMVVGRAMIRDLFEEHDAQRLMSMVTLFFGLAPAVAPIVGGYLYTWFGWTSIFWFLAAVGALLVVVSQAQIVETLPEHARHPFHGKALVRGYQEVGANARFLLLSLAVGFNFNAFFLYVVSAPAFLGERLHLQPDQYAWMFIPGITGIMTGAFISGRVAGHLTPRRTATLAYAFMISASLANVAYCSLLPSSIPWAVIPIMFYAVGTAMAMPSITIITLDLFPTRRGMAASLQGFVSGMINTLTAGVISPFVSHSTLALALAMLAMMSLGLLSWIAYLALARRERRRKSAHPA